MKSDCFYYEGVRFEESFHRVFVYLEKKQNQCLFGSYSVFITSFQIYRYRSIKPSVSTGIDLKRTETVRYLQYNTSSCWFRVICYMKIRCIWQSWYVSSRVIFLEPCFETTATAEAPLRETKYRLVIACRSSSKCVLQMMPSLHTVSDCQVLNEVPEILENREVQNLLRAIERQYGSHL